MKAYKLLKYALGILLMASCHQENPVLTVEGGQIQGVETGIDGITVYKGIPYAAPPVGQNRWKAPQPVVAWEDVRVCDTFGAPCIQNNHSGGGYTPEFFYEGDPEFSEDCLYMNIWTPAAGQTSKKLPVTLWIHGGGFTGGWGSEPEMDGTEWARHDAILVTFNYRLGIFGFLAHPLLSEESEEHISGNYGLLDQIAALKWVKANIAQFGGDPDNITLMGQSAGARSVQYLIASEKAKGLFDKAIMQSGAPYVENAAQSIQRLETAQENGLKVMEWKGATTLEKMRALSEEEVFTLSSDYQKATGERAGISTSPVLDGCIMAEDFAHEALSQGIADIPYMIGCTLDDMGDRSQGIDAFALAREKAGKPCYAYQFCRRLPSDGREGVLEGAFHSSELWFMFKTLASCWRPFTAGDYDLSEQMITAWTSFSRTGNPNSDKDLGWKALTSSSQDAMLFRLDENDQMASHMGAINQYK